MFCLYNNEKLEPVLNSSQTAALTIQRYQKTASLSIVRTESNEEHSQQKESNLC